MKAHVGLALLVASCCGGRPAGDVAASRLVGSLDAKDVVALCNLVSAETADRESRVVHVGPKSTRVLVERSSAFDGWTIDAALQRSIDDAAVQRELIAAGWTEAGRRWSGGYLLMTWRHPAHRFGCFVSRRRAPGEPATLFIATAR